MSSISAERYELARFRPHRGQSDLLFHRASRAYALGSKTDTGFRRAQDSVDPSEEHVPQVTRDQGVSHTRVGERQADQADHQREGKHLSFAKSRSALDRVSSY